MPYQLCEIPVDGVRNDPKLRSSMTFLLDKIRSSIGLPYEIKTAYPGHGIRGESWSTSCSDSANILMEKLITDYEG